MTRLSLFLLILTLCALVIYSDIKGTNFEAIFKVFSDLILMVASFFFGKSATQTAQVSTTDSSTSTVLQG